MISKDRHKLVAFENLKNFVRTELDAVNTLIIESAHSYAELIPTITNYLTSSGGKRLRPVLTLASAKMLGMKGEAHIKLATAVEYIHTATLLHDDVIDESELRRGKKTANNVWGNKPSILVGDYLLSQSFKMMVDAGSLKALDLLASTATLITESEVWQLELIHKTDMSIDEYIKLITGKTAVLFAASCSVGAVALELPKKIGDALYNFGLNLGICFQIMDDILDYCADPKEFGKNIGNDLLEGKVTLPLIFALKDADNHEREFIKKLILGGNVSQEGIDTLRVIFKKCDAFGKALQVAEVYCKKGLEELEFLPIKYDTTYLKDIIIEQLERFY